MGETNKAKRSAVDGATAQRVTAGLEAWFASLTDATARTYRDSLRQLARLASEAGHPTSSIDAVATWAVASWDDFTRWMQQYLDDDGLATGTRKKAASSVRGMLAALRGQGIRVARWEPRLPAREVGAARTPVADRDWAQALEGQEGLLELRTSAILRLAECGLKPAQIRKLRFPESISQMPLLRAGRARWEVSAIAWAAMQRWVDRRGHGPGWLFLALDGRSGRLLDSPVDRRSMQRAAQKFGVSLLAVRRRSLVETAHEDGIHAAGMLAQIINPADITAAMKATWALDPSERSVV